MQVGRWVAILLGGVLVVGVSSGAQQISLHFSGHLSSGQGTCQQVSNSQISCQIPAGSSGTITLTATVSPAENPVAIAGSGIPSWVQFRPASSYGTVSTQVAISPPPTAVGQAATLVFTATTAHNLRVQLQVQLQVTAARAPPSDWEVTPPVGASVTYSGATDAKGEFAVPLGDLATTVTGTLTKCTLFPLPDQEFVVQQGDGFFVFSLPGYLDTIVEEFTRFVIPFVNITTYDAGIVCMLPGGVPDLQFKDYASYAVTAENGRACRCLDPSRLEESCDPSTCQIRINAWIGNPVDPVNNPGNVRVESLPVVRLRLIEGDRITGYDLAVTESTDLQQLGAAWMQLWRVQGYVDHPFDQKRPARFELIIDPDRVVEENDETNNLDFVDCSPTNSLDKMVEIWPVSGVLKPAPAVPNGPWTLGKNRALSVTAKLDGGEPSGDGREQTQPDSDTSSDSVEVPQPQLSEVRTVSRYAVFCPSCACYEWDFNDDGVIDAWGKDGSYSYASNGVYTIQLTVTVGNQTRTDTQTVEVTDRPLVTLVSGFERTFIAGVSVPNNYTAHVTDNENTIERVDFTMNGVTTSRPPGSAVMTYDMGGLRPYPATNTLTVIAYGRKADGTPVSSPSVTKEIPIAPVPGWLVWALGLVSGMQLTPNLSAPPEVLYGASFGFPDPPIAASFEIPSYIPLLEGTYEMSAAATFAIAVSSLARVTPSFEAGASFTKKGGEWTFSIAGKITGQGTLDIGPPIQLLAGQLSASVEGMVSKDFDLTDAFPSLKAASRIPLLGSAIEYLVSRATIGLGVSVGIAGTADFTSVAPGPGRCTEGFDCRGTVSLSGGVNASLTADLSVVSAKAYGGATLTVAFTAPGDELGFLDFDSLTLSGKFGLEVTADVLIGEISKDFSIPFSCSIASPVEGFALEEESPWQFLERPYATPTFDSYREEVVDDPDLGTRELLLVAEVFPLARPALAATPQLTWLVWTTDDLAKPFPRGREIVSSVGDNLATMSPPQAVTDNELPDSHAVVGLTEGGIPCVVWVQHTLPPLGALTEDDVTPELFTPLEIVYATYDRQASHWGSPVQLTSNNIAEHSPQLVMSERGVTGVVWTSNEAGEVFPAPNSATPDSLYYAQWTGSGFGPPVLLAAHAPGTRRSVIDLGGSLLMAWVEDTDGNWETIGDLEVFAAQWKAEEWTARERLTEDTVDDENPLLVPVAGGRAALLWSHGITESAEHSGTLLSQIYDGEVWQPRIELLQASHLAGAVFAWDGEGRVAVVWEGFSNSGPDLHSVVCDPVAGTCTDLRQLTADQHAESQISASFDGRRLLVGFVRTNVEEVTEIVAQGGDGKEITFPAPQSTDLVLLRVDVL